MGGETLIVPMLTCGLNNFLGQVAHTSKYLRYDVFNYRKGWNLHQLYECNEFTKEIKTTKLPLLKYPKARITKYHSISKAFDFPMSFLHFQMNFIVLESVNFYE